MYLNLKYPLDDYTDDVLITRCIEYCRDCCLIYPDLKDRLNRIIENRNSDISKFYNK